MALTENSQPLPVVRIGEIPVEQQTDRWLVEHLWGDSSVGVIGELMDMPAFRVLRHRAP
jgi:hypothetical protein